MAYFCLNSFNIRNYKSILSILEKDAIKNGNGQKWKIFLAKENFLYVAKGKNDNKINRKIEKETNQ